MDKRVLTALLCALLAAAAAVVLFLTLGGGQDPAPGSDAAGNAAPPALAALTAAVSVSASGKTTVEPVTGEAFFPDEQNWVYHFSYAYPQLQGEDYTAALINDTYRMTLDEMLQVVLPMFANAPDMRFDGKNEVIHDYQVMCNNDRLLSILQYRTQTMGEEGVNYLLEPLTFDMSGDYAGESLTLRGVVLAQAGVAALDDVTSEDYPELAAMINGSSTGLSNALMPVLYEKFTALQREGALPAALTYEDFEEEFVPSRDFFANDQGEIVFFFPPSLMASPSYELITFAFTPEQLSALLEEMPPEAED